MFFHKRVISEARISREVAHDQYLIFGDNVTAKGNFARSRPSFGKVGWQSGLGFEPLPIFVDEGYKRYWHFKKFR